MKWMFEYFHVSFVFITRGKISFPPNGCVWVGAKWALNPLKVNHRKTLDLRWLLTQLRGRLFVWRRASVSRLLGNCRWSRQYQPSPAGFTRRLDLPLSAVVCGDFGGKAGGFAVLFQKAQTKKQNFFHGQRRLRRNIYGAGLRLIGGVGGWKGKRFILVPIKVL